VLIQKKEEAKVKSKGNKEVIYILFNTKVVIPINILFNGIVVIPPFQGRQHIEMLIDISNITKKN